MIAENKCYDIINKIKENKILAVVRTNNVDEAIKISKALIDGGIKLIEITMNFPDAYKAIKEISSINGVYVAGGSIITAQQANKAIESGACLIISPVLEMRLIKLCKSEMLPMMTGAATPNEAYEAWKSGVNMLKIFPAKALGGASYIKDILTPMPFLHLMPTGGIDLDNFTEYLDAGAIAVGIGKALYENEENPENITKKAQILLKKLKDYQNQKENG